MQRGMQFARWFLVIVGAVVLTSFTVDATLGGGGISQSALGIFASTLNEKATDGCKEGMVRLGGDFAKVCVDIYEASPSPLCPEKNMSSALSTQRNIADPACKPQSAQGGSPWTYVTQHQAQELCARAGKRLLSNAEWYRAALGTPDSAAQKTCNIESDGLTPTGDSVLCTSGVGVFDAIGNAWEWIDGGITDNTYNERTLPQSGYVEEADQDGLVTKTSEQPVIDFHEDYFWTTDSGSFGILRGGAHGNARDAGLYSVQAKTPLSFAGGAVGFRCAYDL